MIILSESIKIALVGKKRSGKDLASAIIHSESTSVISLSFGSAMKYHAHRIFTDVPEEPKPRSLYQFMDKMREYDPLVWIKHLDSMYKILSRDYGYGTYVITDVRSEDQAIWCRENGFTLVKIHASDEIRRERLENAGETYDEHEFYHPTELSVDNIATEYVIINEGTVTELEDAIKGLVQSVNNGVTD